MSKLKCFHQRFGKDLDGTWQRIVAVIHHLELTRWEALVLLLLVRFPCLQATEVLVQPRAEFFRQRHAGVSRGLRG